MFSELSSPVKMVEDGRVYTLELADHLESEESDDAIEPTKIQIGYRCLDRCTLYARVHLFQTANCS